MCIFVAAIRKERKTYLLYSLTFTSKRKEQMSIIGAASL